MALTPSATHASASSMSVMPQTLMCTGEGTMLRVGYLTRAGWLAGHLAYSILSSSLTLAMTCGAWIGLVMYAFAPSCSVR